MSGKSSVVAVLAGLSLSAYPSTHLPACDADGGGISLPAGFCAVVVADQVGAPRHLAIAPNGDVFVALENRRGGPGGILALRDTTGDGRADVEAHFGTAGGTGVALAAGARARSSERRQPHGEEPGALERRQDVVRELWVGNELVPGRGPHAPVARAGSLPRAGLSLRHLAVRRRKGEPDGSERHAVRDRYPQRRGAHRGTRRPGLGHAARSRPTRAELAEVLQRLAERREALRGAVTGERGGRLRLAVLLPRPRARPPGTRPRVRWRRQTGRALRPEEGAGGVVPRTLGARRLDLLRRDAVPRALSGRRVHRLPRLVEPGAAPPSGVPRGVRALQERQPGGRLRDVRGRLLEAGLCGTQAPARGRGGGPGRLAVHHRRRGRQDLAGDVQRAVGGGKGR